MLVLSRNVGEVIRIGKDVEILVVAVDRNRVRIGVKAPKETEVYREEVWKAIQEQNHSKT